MSDSNSTRPTRRCAWCGELTQNELKDQADQADQAERGKWRATNGTHARFRGGVWLAGPGTGRLFPACESCAKRLTSRYLKQEVES